MVGISASFVQRLVALLGEVPRHVGIDVLEHRCRCRPCPAAAGCRASPIPSARRGPRRRHSAVSAAWRSSSHSPSATQVRLQPLDRVAERPRLGLVGRAVAGRVVGGRMALGAIGEELDQRRAAVRARALGRPLHRGIDRERVIAVDAQAGDAVADGALGEGRALGAGDAREARDRPLVVDHREDDRRIVDRGEGHRASGSRPRRSRRRRSSPCDAAVALDRGGHRPADRLRELGAEIARDREEAVRLVRIHDRQLAALQLVAFVRVDLVHHLDQRIAARDEQALLAIGREVHVVAVQRGGGGDRDRLLAGALHVEAGLSLALGAVHAVVEDADRDHVAQHLAQRVGVELGVPRADRLMVIAEHADEVGGQRVGLGRRDAGVGARRLAGGRES